jgi:DNA-binding MarR family transcriptional regulator
MYSTRVVTMPEAPTPGFLVWKLALRWRAAVDRAVAPFGLTQGQYSVLASLSGVARTGGRPSQRELADHTGLEVVHMSKLVRALERRGLVARTPDPDDARAVQLSLSDDGRAVARRAVAAVRALQDELTAPLGGIDAPATHALVEVLTQLLDHATTSTTDAPGGAP